MAEVCDSTTDGRWVPAIPSFDMSEQEKISQLVKAVFRGWQGAGINFLVLRNYENLPDHTAKVIDVLVNLEQLQQAEEILLAAAQETGFALHNRAEFATLALYLSEKESGVQAHFDLSADLKWRGFDFLCCEEFLERKISRGLFSVLNPVDEAATNLMSVVDLHREGKGQIQDLYRCWFPGRGRSSHAVAGEDIRPGPRQAFGRKRNGRKVGTNRGQHRRVAAGIGLSANGRASLPHRQISGERRDAVGQTLAAATGSVRGALRG